MLGAVNCGSIIIDNILLPSMNKPLPERCFLMPMETHDDWRGRLAVLTNGIPKGFTIERVYYVQGLAGGQERGAHAHRIQSQILFVLNGEISVTLEDQHSTYSIEMDSHSDGILMGPVIWCTIKSMRDGSAYLIFANGLYDPSEYITDYDEFKKIRQEIL